MAGNYGGVIKTESPGDESSIARRHRNILRITTPAMNTDGASKPAARCRAAPTFLTLAARNRRHDSNAISRLECRHVLAYCGNRSRRIGAKHERQNCAARIRALSYRQIKAAIDRYGGNFQNDFVKSGLWFWDIFEQELLRTPKGAQHHSLHSRSPFVPAQFSAYECDNPFVLTSVAPRTSAFLLMSYFAGT